MNADVKGMKPIHPLPSRRKRSHLSRNDCLLALEHFAKRVARNAESSGGSPFDEFAPPGHLTVVFLVKGSFGVADDVFEAIRVLAGYKLPRR
jgi:hypothetical protein